MISAFNRRGSLFAGVAAGLLMFAVAMIPEKALAHSGAGAVTECRTTVGKPIVRACVRSKVQHQGGKPRAYVQGCRADAMPAVRACVQQMVPHLIGRCRETVGRPMVQACVQSRMQREGGHRRHFVEHCRLSVSWAVRACVWRSAAVAPAVTGR